MTAMTAFEALARAGSQIARAAVPMRKIKLGPWKGSVRALPQDKVPLDYIADTAARTAKNALYMPRTGYWRRRDGQTVKFDTLTAGHAALGLLPGVWGASPSATSVGARWRWGEEYDGPINTDGIPSVMGLATRETVASSCLDDGRFSNLWLRDQVNSAQYTVGSEFSATTYPLPGSPQSYKFVPLRYDSGDGGITRGAGDNFNATRSEFARRFFFGGSRRFIKSGTWWYFPSVLGTPSRWIGDKAGDSVGTSLPSSSLVGGGNFQDWGTNGAFGGVAWQCIETNDGATSYIRNHQDIGTIVSDFGLTNGPLSTAINSWTVTFVARYNPTLAAIAVGSVLQFGIVRSNGNRKISADFAANVLTNAFATYTATVTFDGTGETTGNTANSMRITNVVPPGSNGDAYIEVTMISVAPAGGQVGFRSNRLIPSGPWPPTHAGYLTVGNQIASSADATTMTPNGDTGVDGGWAGVGAGTPGDLNTYIDESAADDDTSYISSVGGGAAGNVTLTDPGFAPTTQTVTLNFRARRLTIPFATSLQVDVVGNATVRATTTVVLSGAWTYYNLVLTPAQIALLTSDSANWSDIKFRFTAIGSGSGSAAVTQAQIIISAGGATEGAWAGKDQFFFSVAYRFEDDSVWMPCQPRFPNDILTAGFNLFTVDASNTVGFYDKIVWHPPVAPKSVKELLLLRSPKIDSLTQDVRQLNPFDLRLVETVKNGVTTYEDYYANDDTLAVDPGRSTDGRDGFFIRFDHRMPPRARHIAAGDLRVVHSYGGDNPCAIEIAPVGRTADYDLNLNDETATLYNQSSMYIRLTLSSAGVAALTLNKSDGTTLTTTSLALATYDTLQKLVDAINATSVATHSQQWRAQLCPFVDPAANSTASLLPNFRTIDSCVVSGQTITKAGGGLSKVAVGALVSGTGVTRGAYISRIDSDTQLTFVGTITAATKTLNFDFELGDDPQSVGAPQTAFGYQRVIANSLPAFVFFNSTYLAQFPIEKAATWMTIAPPGSMKSAPNSFSNKPANVHRPPNAARAGISMGAAAVDQGFLVGFANQIGAIRNERDQGSGVDEEYRLQIMDESSGAVSPIVPGNRTAFLVKPEGVYAYDLFRAKQLSTWTWMHEPNPRGDFDYEMPKAIAAAARDIDVDVADTTIAGYFHLRVMKSALRIAYRASGSHPNREVRYDFSSDEPAGLDAVVRPDGEPYGWSLPLIRSITAMTEGRRSDGLHLYAWNDENGGSTGDGRIDEIDTSDTDNGTAIASLIPTPLIPNADETDDYISAQEVTVEHSSPAASTGTLDFVRSLQEATSTLTLTTSAQVVNSELKFLPQAARAVTRAVYMAYKQATGGARELRSMLLKAKMVRRYRGGPS